MRCRCMQITLEGIDSRGKRDPTAETLQCGRVYTPADKTLPECMTCCKIRPATLNQQIITTGGLFLAVYASRAPRP